MAVGLSSPTLSILLPGPEVCRTVPPVCLFLGGAQEGLVQQGLEHKVAATYSTMITALMQEECAHVPQLFPGCLCSRYVQQFYQEVAEPN